MSFDGFGFRPSFRVPAVEGPWDGVKAKGDELVERPALRLVVGGLPDVRGRGGVGQLDGHVHAARQNVPGVLRDPAHARGGRHNVQNLHQVGDADSLPDAGRI